MDHFVSLSPIAFSIVILAVSALLADWFTVPFSIWLANRVGAIDKPGANKIHFQPVPRLGGLGILLAFGLTLSGLFIALDIPGFVYQQVIILLSLLLGMAIIGFLDDVRGLREWIKFVLEGLIALTFIYLIGVDLWWVAVITWFWVVALINGYNFLDGMDGMAASVAVINLFALLLMFLITGNVILAVTAGALAMATLGFLRYNWPPAKIFMGDIGSLSLGFVISVLSLLLVISQNFSLNVIMAIVLTASLPLGDVVLTFLRRLMNHKPLFPADRGHFYDQMVERGGLSKLDTVRVSLITAALVNGLGVTALVFPAPLAIGSLLFGGGILLLAMRRFRISLRWEMKMSLLTQHN